MKEITIEWLQKKEACQAGIDFFKKQDNHEVFATLERQKENNPQWANWLLTKMFTKKQNIQYAIFAAEQVLPIFEKKYPGDLRPRQAIDAAKEYLKNPNRKNKADAAAYAYAAADAAAAYADAAAAAYAAAYAAAAAAAADAAAAYAYAAYAYAAAADAYAAYAYAAAADAYAAAADAAAAYAYAAARKEMQVKILNYGINLLKGE